MFVCYGEGGGKRENEGNREGLGRKGERERTRGLRERERERERWAEVARVKVRGLNSQCSRTCNGEVSHAWLCFVQPRQYSYKKAGLSCLFCVFVFSVACCLTKKKKKKSTTTAHLRNGSCMDEFTCCHTEIGVAVQTRYRTQLQGTDAGPASPSIDSTTQASVWLDIRMPFLA